MTDAAIRPAALRAARRSAVQTTGLVALLVGAYAVLPFRGDRWWLGALVGAALLVAMGPLTVRRVRSVLRSDRPGLEAAAALVLLLAMLVVGFAAVYFAMDRDQGQFSGLRTRIDAVYFTVTTLSTVGFGDITATSQAARLVVTAQILFDVAFVGVAVRVFVGAARRGRAGSADL
ncbi:MAG TPA: potassium channel family protein [Acidimicrobiales bacterium]|nr:potassium channel family protein [Acidimicrobiales bacterium]